MQAQTGAGLSARRCRFHVQFRNRHGSYTRGTLTAADLKPFRDAARQVLRDHANNPVIAGAERSLFLLFLRAGRSLRVVDTLVAPVEQKARAALARMRDASIAPSKLLWNQLAITALVRSLGDGFEGDREDYRLTQIAKACFRLASGYHANYGEGARYDRYPRSAGLVLRVLGRLIDEACAQAAERFVPDIMALAAARSKVAA